MDATIPVVAVLAILAFGAASVAVLGYALPKLKHEEQGYPKEAEIEAALLPHLFEAICSAYRVSEWSMDELAVRLAGVDKQALAHTVYDLLPDYVGKFPLHVVKAVVSRERFAELVQDAFARFDRDFITFQVHWDELFEDWKDKYNGE
jgi:hypothetical protein